MCNQDIDKQINRKSIVMFGLGDYFYSYYIRLSGILNIDYLCDHNSDLLEKFRGNDIGICISPDELLELENPLVIISAGNEEAVRSIRNELNKYDISNYHAEEVLNKNGNYPYLCKSPNEFFFNNNRKFIDITLDGTLACNFRCEYCYLKNRSEAYLSQTKTSNYAPIDIRKGLSKKRLGGKCFINICARGETMLSKDIVELTFELLCEGHVVSIVTNGTISNKFDQLIEFPLELQKNLFIKFSFHYLELKRLNLIEVFFNNVDKIKNSLSSYTIEITPCDNLVPYIEEIKLVFEKYANSAMPHISFARDSAREDLAVLTSLPLDEYNRIWGQFNSKMFDLKSRWYKKKISDFCYAGDWSCRINLLEGSIQPCYHHKSMGNLFSELEKPFPIQAIKEDCRMPYCFNNHAYLAFGCIPSIKCYSYLDMRDRVDKEGKHWVKQELGEFLSQKLYNNNYQYAYHCEYTDGLYRNDRSPAFIILNSPHYSNIGDHAIVMAEKSFLAKIDNSRYIYEITSNQYKHSNIREYIRADDVLIITGGGYLGSLWISLEDTVRLIMNNHPDNIVIIFPQSLYFHDSLFGRRECQLTQEIYNRHKKLSICLRDRNSYQLASKIFNNHIRKLFLPDVALLLDYREQSYQRSGALICLREDRESIINMKEKLDIRQELQDKFTNIEVISNVDDKYFSLDKREEMVTRFVEKLKKAEVVITDRLHTMLFCAISETPCLVLDNISHKVHGVYEWISHLDYIQKIDKPQDIEKKLNMVINSTTKFNPNQYEEAFEPLRRLIIEAINSTLVS